MDLIFFKNVMDMRLIIAGNVMTCQYINPRTKTGQNEVALRAQWEVGLMGQERGEKKWAKGIWWDRLDFDFPLVGWKNKGEEPSDNLSAMYTKNNPRYSRKNH